MNAAQALGFMRARLQPDIDPVLDINDFVSLLPMAATCDDDGNEPTDDDWTPTYSEVGCYRAIAEGWTMKYGRAVGRFPFTTDGQNFQRNKVLDHIEHQRKLYARKVQSSPSTLGAAT
jgi:hypothetical protein